MGEEIDKTHFSKKDFKAFQQKLMAETTILKEMFSTKTFALEHAKGGFELEAWLLNKKLSPAPVNNTFLKKLKHPLVEPELAQYNIELNSIPHTLQKNALQKMHKELQEQWQSCRQQAEKMKLKLMMIGILPTAKPKDFSVEFISQNKRFEAINEQIMQQHSNNTVQLDIIGKERFQHTHHNIMMESAATAFQIHMQLTQESAHHFYNASLLIAAPAIAVSANSPFLCGKNLWSETRIPLFEQSLFGKNHSKIREKFYNRASLGTGYLKKSLFELYEENIQNHPIFLPVNFAESATSLHHIRIHNGTIWRWVRPILGFEKEQAHLRIEIRYLPAGPTLTDSIANAAFVYGLLQYYGTIGKKYLKKLAFSEVCTNFSIAAKSGLNCGIRWFDNKIIPITRLILDKLLPNAQTGLKMLNINEKDIQKYLEIIQQRTERIQNGSNWQRQFKTRYNCSFQELCDEYIQRQDSGKAVHEWEI